MNEPRGIALTDYFVSVPVPHVQGPPPGLIATQPGRAQARPRRSRRALLLGPLMVALLGVGGYVVATREPAPDLRPIVLPETLDGLSRAESPNSTEYRERMEQGASAWWPNRSADFALYSSDNVRLDRVKGQAGPHVLVVRSRFGDKGDAHFSERSKRDGFDIQTEKQKIGRNSCEWTQTIVTVCWRETDRLSVSVLTMDHSEADRVSAQVDEVWNAVR